MLTPGYPRPIALALAGLFVHTTATTVLLIDQRGQMCAAQGDCLRAELKQHATLIAGTMQSAREVQLNTNPPSDGILITQGIRENLVCAPVSGAHVLALIVPKGKALSSIKQHIQHMLPELNDLLEQR
jgi:hypothetical protein